MNSQSHQQICTRIAPSPTGEPHVGTAYIALFNWVFARQNGGRFILRSEDTDQTRSSKQSEDRILSALKWLGLNWDEGPDIGGPSGPYRQSERLEIYQTQVQELLKRNEAFYCFCTTQRLNQLRQRQTEQNQTTRYDGHCCNLHESEIQQRLQAKESYVIRLKIPTEGDCEFTDALRGGLNIGWDHVDMQILMKADGFPTYHLASVVDDHLMGVTHVIRGEEWINSTPKHIRLYQAFDWQPPKFYHLPLLRNIDKSKLSKRKNPTSIFYYKRMGFLATALVNFLGRMGYSLPNDQEKFTVQEMVDSFDWQRISLGGPIFDQEKLRWLNGMWSRDLTIEKFVQQAQQWAFSAEDLAPILPSIQKRVEVFSDIAPLIGFLYSGRLTLKADDFNSSKIDLEKSKEILHFSRCALETLAIWNKTTLFEIFSWIAERMELKVRDFMNPLFIAVTGSLTSVPLMEAMSVLGPELTLARIRDAIDLLGGVSKKQQKVLDKTWQSWQKNSHAEENTAES
ncbi:MAG: glutamate--tRNA ligase [Pseudomonadota bacterium]